MSLEKLSEKVYTWFRYSATLGYDLNGHVLVGDEGLLLVDPPELSYDEVDEVESLGDPQLVVITNRTHWRDTSAHLERWPLQVVAHEVEGPRLPRVDRLVVDGERLPDGWDVLFVPGKTVGEIALYSPDEGGTILVGDTVIGEPPGSVGLVPEAKIEDKDQLMHSLRKIASLRFERLLVGDGQSILGAADRVVRAFVKALGE